MTSLSYILQSVPWTLAGVLVGWFMCRAAIVADAIAGVVLEGDAMPDEQIRVPWWKHITSMHVIGAVVVFLGVFTAVQGYVQNEANERLALCTKAYSDGFADAIDVRSKASAEAQEALDDFITAIAKATPTAEGREQIRRAFNDYLSKRAAAKKAQEENPFPAPPRDVC